MRPQFIIQQSIRNTGGGTSSVVSVSPTSAQSAVIGPAGSPVHVIVTPTVDCFVRTGANPTATNDGTDQFLLGGNMYRVLIQGGNRFAFRTASGTGSVFLTPDA